MLLPVLYPFCNSYYQYWQYTYIVGLWCRLDLGFINKEDTISKTSYLYDKSAYLRLISRLNMVYNHKTPQKDKIEYGNIWFLIAQLINAFSRIYYDYCADEEHDMALFSQFPSYYCILTFFFFFFFFFQNPIACLSWAS